MTIPVRGSGYWMVLGLVAFAGSASAQGGATRTVGVSLSALGFVDAGADGELAGRFHWSDEAGAVGFWAATGARYERDRRARTTALAGGGVRLSMSGMRVRIGLDTELRLSRAFTTTGQLTPEQLDSLAQGLERPTEHGSEPIVAPDGDTGYIAETVARLVGSVEWRRRGFAVTLETGLPVHGTPRPRPWLAGTAALDVAPGLALVAGVVHRSASAGGASGENRMALGLSWRAGLAPRRPREGDGPRTAPPGPALAAEASFVAVRLPGSVRLRVRSPATDRVELRSNLTGWRAEVLADDGFGWWSITLPAERGVHRLALRYGNSAWVAPPGLVRAPDGFGGWVGLLYVE